MATLERARPALMHMAYTLSDFDFDLPPELIAQHPAPQRSGSRLLNAQSPQLQDGVFKDLPQWLRPGDLLVFNNTRVVKARLFGCKPSGGKLELLIERVLNDHEVVAHMKVSKKPLIGTELQMDGGSTATLLGRWPQPDGPLFHLRWSQDPYAVMQAHGHVPLPPYITHTDAASDESRYQTIFAKHPGAVAAPTAALHFDTPLFQALRARGIEHTELTLHVGAGTFQPVKVEDLSQHHMHLERYHISADTQQSIAAAKRQGRRIVAVGTTSLRALESAALQQSVPGQDLQGDTQIFIRPGFDFKVVDLLVTNFHLPKSTLMMLVSAFSGFDHMRAVYQHAIDSGYRFFSYGDAMLLERKT